MLQRTRRYFLLKILIGMLVITVAIIGIKKLFPKTKAQMPTSIEVTYSAGNGEGTAVTKTSSVNQDTKRMLLLDFGTEKTNNWTHQDIQGNYKDTNGNNVMANYEATFAGWKLKSINGEEITDVYTYPDNDYIYFNDEPFVSRTITSIEFEALWGKIVYVRDKYNFVDIKNVYGYNVEGSKGDILTAKINWDTSTVYGNDTNSGATKDEPVATIEKAYELLKNTNGGKVSIVNHITLEVSDAGQAYSSTFTNKAETKVYSLGNNLNILGLVTITGKNLGSGTQVEGKANTNNSYVNGCMYIKNTRGAGTYNGKTYTGAVIQLRFYTNVVLEDFSCMGYRENYNYLGARQTGDISFYGTVNKRFVSESTFSGYKRTTSSNLSGLDTGNWSNIAVGSYTALTNGMGGCTHVYGTSASYTKDGKTYAVNSMDNIYVTLRGQNWYNIYGMTNSGTRSINNIHMNVENLISTSIYGIYNGNLTANSITIYTNEVKTSVITPTYNNTITANEINIVMEGNSNRLITNVYGGGYSTFATGVISKINANLNYTINGAKITNFYGGGNQVATLVNGDLDIKIKSGVVTNVFGGGLGGYIGTEENKSNIDITISGGTINYLYGGGSGGSVQLYVGNSTADLSRYQRDGKYFYNGTNYAIYATDRKTYTNSSTKNNDNRMIVKEYTVKDGGTIIGKYDSIYTDLVYPEKTDENLVSYYRSYSEYTVSDATVNGNITINLKNGANITKDVCGGGKNGAVNGNIQINMETGAKVSENIYVGGEGLQSTIEATITGVKLVWTNSEEEHVLNKSTFLEAAGEEGTAWKLAPAEGKYDAFLLAKEINSKFKQSDDKVYIYSSTISKLGLINGSTTLNIKGGAAKNIFGGSNGKVASVSGNTNINISGGSFANVYGGGNKGEVTSTNITITGGTVSGNVYGGGNVADIKGDATITIENETITNNIYGGGYSGNIIGNTIITSTNSTLAKVYAGGYSGNVGGSTTLKISGSTIDKIFGGGYSGNIEKDTTITILDSTLIQAYAGGYSGNVEGSTILNISGSKIDETFGGGYSGYVTGDATTNITTGTFKNVFGGGDQSYITGNTIVNIGDGEDTAVTVTGLAYGGGRGYDSDNDGDASDYTTVNGSSTVTIKGTKANVENYGSIKLGAVAKDVDVIFKDYWTGNTTARYKTMNGIDRATTVKFDNSYVLLENKNSNGELEGIKAIENLEIPDGSGLKISAEGEISGNFIGGGELYLDSLVCLTVGGDISGVTKLVLNPKLDKEDGANKIKGGQQKPYLKVAGSVPTEQALVSGDSKYVILEASPEETSTKYTYYYIAGDVTITSAITSSSTNIAGRKYLKTIDNSNSAIILEDGIFSSNIDIAYEVSQDVENPNKYKNITREFVLKKDKTTFATIPSGTEILLINDGKYYSYIVNEETQKIALTEFKNSEGRKYDEITNFDTSEKVQKTKNQTNGLSEYILNESFRFIVNFENTAMTLGVYYPMINVSDAGVWLEDVQTDTANNIEIKTRSYSLEASLNKNEYENSGIVDVIATANLSGVVDLNIEDNTALYTKLKLIKDNKEQKIPVGTRIVVNDTDNYEASNGVLLIKLIDNLTNQKITQVAKITLDMSNVLEQNRLDMGEYTLKLEGILSKNGSLQNKNICKTTVPFTMITHVKQNANYGLKAEVINNQDLTVDTVQLVENSDAKKRTIKLNYKEGNLKDSKIKIDKIEKIGEFEYQSSSNTAKIKVKSSNVEVFEIANPSETQELEVNFAKGISAGTYRIVFKLYDKYENELTESFVNFIVIDK